MYLFLLGRDPFLSKLEIAIYLNKQNISYSFILQTEKYLILDFNKDLDFKKIIYDLGGITRIVKILKKYNSSKDFDNKFIDFIEYIDNKFNFSFSSIDASKDLMNEMEFFLKDFFKKEKIKAVYKKPRKHSEKEKNYIVNPDNFYSWKLDKKGFELFLIDYKNIIYVGQTIACFNSNDLKFKDKNRPLKKELYATSFRLVRIMINLLGLKENQTFYDPFCGTGTFLIEGLFLKYNVIGSDKSSEMCQISKDNCNWIIKNFNLYNKNTFKIINRSSDQINFKADGVCFEPYMGPFLNNLPNDFRAKKIISNLNELYFKIFENLSKNLKKGSKVVCVLPQLKTFEKTTYDINKNVYLENGFKFLDVSKIDDNMHLENPIFYSTPKNKSKINRYICIFEKI
ncbi:MAG: DNA methyltransferase [Candidatus ainarchaeum sp.]|nr:DNA methyltransferase [Candidatus ainarchaeum sp.]MDD3975933.1 DNA methyltransferase [Candidatus ainarchaeum sp.]